MGGQRGGRKGEDFLGGRSGHSAGIPGPTRTEDSIGREHFATEYAPLSVRQKKKDRLWSK